MPVSQPIEVEKEVDRMTPPLLQAVAVGRLTQFGMTALGARQAVNGEMIIAPADRKALATILQQVSPRLVVK